MLFKDKWKRERATYSKQFYLNKIAHVKNWLLAAELLRSVYGTPLGAQSKREEWVSGTAFLNRSWSQEQEVAHQFENVTGGTARLARFPIQLTPGPRGEPGAHQQVVQAESGQSEGARGVPEALLGAASRGQSWHNAGGATGLLPWLEWLQAGGLNPQPTAGCGRPALRPQGPPVAHALPEAGAESGGSTAGRETRPCASRCRTRGDRQKRPCTSRCRTRGDGQKMTGSSWRLWRAEPKTQTAQEEE